MDLNLKPSRTFFAVQKFEIVLKTPKCMFRLFLVNFWHVRRISWSTLLSIMILHFVKTIL